MAAESDSTFQHRTIVGTATPMSKIAELGSEMRGQASDGAGRQAANPSPLWLRVGFWACLVIAIGAVIRRVFALLDPPHSAPPQLAALDRVFASHASLTLAHILAALAFVLVTPFFVLPKSDETAWPEHVLFPLGVVVGITAYAMSAYSVGGWVERSAVLLFNTLFLFSLLRGYLYMNHGELPLKRRWLFRAIAILLGIAVTRPVMGIFFATSHLSGLQPQQFFGIAFWIGFSTSTLLGEVWLRRYS
jgi:Predicted membrane protein (DUF2306)